MKKTALTLIALVFTATNVLADQVTNNDFTLAAADLGVKTAWVETQEDAELRITEELSEKTDALNEKINAKLEQQLEDKLARDLAL